MIFFIVRHADDDSDIVGGWSQIGITKVGKKQAQQLSLFFKKNKDVLGIRHIISSDLPRALETIRPTADVLGLDIEATEAWRPMNQGKLSGLHASEARKRYPAFVFDKIKANKSFPEGETPQHFFDRTTACFKETANKYMSGNENILICTHGANMAAIWAAFRKENWKYQEHWAFRPCTIMVIDTQRKGLHLINPIIPKRLYYTMKLRSFRNKVKSFLHKKK